ncbi:MAG TPA: selenocysteine-specific translation elongation factor [candidate division Zixibacteria bacterium]|nr:selenocysteine-specific translation elongation factor [candidate division Zixibacteria bacterium]MDD4918145.1 selenocysteine-specific translation elongation factor [candidate division Zixibacteria bacterium]MDM7972088.1 selenocysteine-specific translation elongation factor [candidate division Zixibacteria bacterium]HOD66803.1 selenocysteine-specific translation elongation factor [candidate division Zixibacteria bacterium]HOZ08099.1 selenocysteine-specific translation elongation factor [candi
MIVVGTAGHIDHGKSALVKRLTGTDPDRLPEEKARGMTIDLGFAFYRTPAGATVAFIDVPGHERFVKNMIAGAGGIDAVMLVIAADDGWMPQTEEHFQVVRLLGVRHGLVVINKTDLVEPDWLELLTADIGARLAGTFLHDVPVFAVSAATGAGFDPLREYLNRLPGLVASRKDIGKARLFIDRSFVRPGIGGVVTGTLRGGSLRLGQTVGVWPARTVGKIRSLHSGGDSVDLAEPGQRTAVSFTGVDREQLLRGGVITDRTDLEYFPHHPVLALSLELLPNAPVALEDRRRVLLIVGTTEVEGEIRLFRAEEIRPGGSGLVFFQPDQPVYALIGDRCIMRLPTPMVTLGGGQVLDHLRFFPRRRALDRYDYLLLRSSGRLEDLVRSELQKRTAVHRPHLLEHADCAETAINQAVTRLIDSGQAALYRGYVFEPTAFAQALERFKRRLEKHFERKSHLKGVPIETLQQLSPYGRETTDLLIQYALENRILVRHDDEYSVAGRGMTLAGPVRTAYDEIMAALRADPWAPPKLADLTSRGKAHREAIRFILDSREGHKCGADFIFLADTWQTVLAYIRERLDRTGELAITDLRDRFGFTRKFAVPILEETDRLRLTRREGDLRVKGERYEVPLADL